MVTTKFRAGLRTVGWALVVVGVLDIAYMFWVVSNGHAYSSSLNLFALLAGVFILRGSVRAAVLVRYFSAFFLAAICSLMILWPIVQPIDLSIQQLKLDWVSAASAVGFIVGMAILFYWLLTNTNTDDLQAKQLALGRKWRSIKIPLFLGVALVVILSIVMSRMQNSESGIKAKSIASAQLGADYKYFVSSLSYVSSSNGTNYRGTVTAWKSGDVRTIPFAWSEK